MTNITTKELLAWVDEAELFMKDASIGLPENMEDKIAFAVIRALIKRSEKVDALVEAVSVMREERLTLGYARTGSVDAALVAEAAYRIAPRALIAQADDVERLVEAEIAKIESDGRYYYKPADVFINAPLALIQVSMAGQMRILKMVQAALKAKRGG